MHTGEVHTVLATRCQNLLEIAMIEGPTQGCLFGPHSERLCYFTFIAEDFSHDYFRFVFMTEIDYHGRRK